MLRVGVTRVRPRRQTREPQEAHQAPDPLASDPVPPAAQVHRDLAAAVERVPSVFGVDRLQQPSFLLIPVGGRVWRIDRGPGDPGQVAWSGQRDGIMGADPLPARCDRLIPDFFLSQSSSIFSRPISE